MDENEKLLDVAETLVEREGLEGLTMDALAEAAGMSRATVYRRVGSREALVARLVERGVVRRTQIEQGDVTERVLEAMRQVLAREGFSGTTVEGVAREAGVGVATVYRRFGGREGLFEAFTERYSPRRMARDLLAGDEDLEADLTRLAREVLGFLREHPELVRLRMSGDPEVRRLLGSEPGGPTRMLPTLARYFERQMGAGRIGPADPMDLAAAFGGLLTGFGLIEEDFRGQRMGEEEVERVAGRVVAIFLDGVRKGAEMDESGGMRGEA